MRSSVSGVQPRPVRARWLAVLLLTGVAFALFASVTRLGTDRADAAGPRTLTAEPADELGNQVVRVRWSGFTPTNPDPEFNFPTVTLYQCTADPQTLADCYTSIRPGSAGSSSLEGTGIGDALTDANGDGTAQLEIRPEFDLPSLGCREAQPCSVVAFENDGLPIPSDGLPATAVVAEISFARSPADCPEVSTFDVVTSGEASAIHAMDKWAAAKCTGNDALSVDTTEKTSFAGRRDFTAGNLDIGITSMPADAATTAASTRSFVYAPLDVSAVVVAFNVNDAVTGARITDMTLTPRLLAILLGGQQIAGPGSHLFQDAEFQALNTGHSWPGRTPPPLIRGELNADTYLATRWIQEDTAARAFLDGADPTAVVDDFWRGIAYPTESFESHPVLTGYVPVESTRTITRDLLNFRAADNSVSVTPGLDGLIGLVDIVTAKQFGLPTAKLVPANAPGGTPVAPDPAGLAAGLAAMGPTSANASTRQANVDAGNGAYPLVKIDYGMVPTSGTTPEKALAIASFLDYATGDGQADGVLPDGYLPLTDAERQQAEDAAAAMLAAAATPPPTPPADTTPPANDSFNADGFSGSFDDGGFSGSDFSGSDFDDFGSDLAVAGDVPGGDPSDDGDSDSNSDTSDSEPLSVRFLGSQGSLVLPVVLALGLAALIVGPTIGVAVGRGERKPKSGAPNGSAPAGGEREGAIDAEPAQP